MRNKAQSTSKCGSVGFYVTKRVVGWNAVPRACRFYPSKVRFCKFAFCEDLKNNINIHNSLFYKMIPFAPLKAFETFG